jgi:hypothetical protein
MPDPFDILDPVTAERGKVTRIIGGREPADGGQITVIPSSGLVAADGEGERSPLAIAGHHTEAVVLENAPAAALFLGDARLLQIAPQPLRRDLEEPCYPAQRLAAADFPQPQLQPRVIYRQGDPLRQVGLPTPWVSSGLAAAEPAHVPAFQAPSVLGTVIALAVAHGSPSIT